MIRKVIINDGRARRELLLIESILVGRDAACQINDADQLLSRRHAEFVVDSTGVTVRDLGSRNGIFVNGSKVPEHALRTGDVVQLGHLHLEYIEEVSVVPPQESAQPPAPSDDDAPTMAPQAKAAASYSTTHPARQDAPQTAPEPAAPPSETPGHRPAATGGNGASPMRPSPGDFDATMVPAAYRPAPADIDVPREPAAAARDLDATIAPLSFNDVTRGVPTQHSQAATLSGPVEATLVMNLKLVVTEASPACRELFGVAPDTLVGGELADIVTRSLNAFADGDAGPTLSVVVERGASGRTITATFKAEQAIETVR